MRHQIGLALRRLRATPGFTIIALTALAFGIGLNILIFSFTSPVLLKAMPYPEPDRLLDISMAPPGKPESRGVVTPRLYFLLRDRTAAAFDAVGVFDAGRSANLAGDAGGPTGTESRRRASRRSAPHLCLASSRRPPTSRAAPWCSATRSGSGGLPAARTSSIRPCKWTDSPLRSSA